MTKCTIHSIAKAIIPQRIRRLIRCNIHYLQRICRWIIILWQIRGDTWIDQWTLIRSALASPFLSFQNLMEWQDPILLADATVSVRGIGKFIIRARCDDLWHVLPWRERAIFSTLRNTLRLDDIFIDAGANIGIYTVLASQLVGPRGKVIAIEMMPNTANQLEKNLKLNAISNVTVYKYALSNTPNEHIIASFTPGKYGKSSIIKIQENNTILKLCVKTTTLDEITKGITSVRLIKMDLEGAESVSIQGAKQLLQKTNFLIYENWSISHTANNSIHVFLQQAGYKLRQIDGNNWLASHQYLL